MTYDQFFNAWENNLQKMKVSRTIIYDYSQLIIPIVPSSLSNVYFIFSNILVEDMIDEVDIDGDGRIDFEGKLVIMHFHFLRHAIKIFLHLEIISEIN